MKQPKFSLTVIAALALAACQQPADDANIMIDNQVNTAEAANADVETLPPSEDAGAPAQPNNAAAPVGEAANDSENSPSTAVVPAQYRGRWGINANDCDPKRSDNKGLMTVRENSIRFYESTASLQEQRPAIATSFSGTYSFTGEGQTWKRMMTLTRTGDKLKRADNEGSYTYRRCV